jgi:hypothetical protein
VPDHATLFEAVPEPFRCQVLPARRDELLLLLALRLCHRAGTVGRGLAAWRPGAGHFGSWAGSTQVVEKR